MKYSMSYEQINRLSAALMPAASESVNIETPAFTVLPTPTADLLPLWDLGVAGIPLAQYLRWADDVDLLVAMTDRETMLKEEIVSCTTLTARGVDAMLGVLCSLRLVTCEDGGRYRLSNTAREYLDRRSPFYVGPALYGNLDDRIPGRLRKGEKVRRFSRATGSLWDKLRYFRSRNQWGRPERLLVQHSRNFPAAVIAARSEHFDGLKHLADIGGGSGVFAIPLALDRPDLRITLVELPRALPHVKKFLVGYGVESRVALLGCNVHARPWPLEQCDGILFGNFMHFCADDECLMMLQECYRLLPAGGRVLLHEMLWNDSKDGPLITALWNFWLTSISAGRQRTKAEFVGLLSRAGFDTPVVIETGGGFSLIVSVK